MDCAELGALPGHAGSASPGPLSTMVEVMQLPLTVAPVSWYLLTALVGAG